MIRKKLAMLLLGVAMISLSSRANAGCCVTCPNCQACCKLDVDEVMEDKHCWQVECKDICVPNIVFPWQKSCCNPCVNNGAKVITVNVLKKHSYECPACEYTWTLEENACGAGCCGNGCCDAGCCDAGCCDAGGTEIAPAASGQPEPAVAPPPTPSAGTYPEPPTQRVTVPPPGYFESTKSRSSKLALPVRFIRAAKLKLTR